MAALRDGDASAQASVSNVNGNSATTTHAYSVDASAPTVTINTIAGDEIRNAAETGAALTITGSSTAEAGRRHRHAQWHKLYWHGSNGR